MRSLLMPAALVVLLASCNNASDATTGVDQVPDSADLQASATPLSTFPELFAYLQGEDTSFSPAKFIEEYVVRSEALVETKVDSAALRPFEPYLLYNPSRTWSVDAVSHNYVPRTRDGKKELAAGGPDVEIALIDWTKGIRQRLFFSGTMSAFLDARWEGDSTLLLALAPEVSGDSIRPAIWRYRIGDDGTTRYQYPGKIRANIGSYAEQRLNRPQR